MRKQSPLWAAVASILLLAAMLSGCASSSWDPPEADAGQRTLPPGQDGAVQPPPP
ncbi:MAG: hypothetical protein JRI55_23365, partial [Deltaproteobacteria bacterium]|nr:hypothetical protein [Deltaproteobacteria bacterium]